MRPERSAGGVSAVVGVGNTDWVDDYKAVRAGKVPTDAYGYGAIALQRALADAGIDKSEVDGLITAPYTPVERAADLLKHGLEDSVLRSAAFAGGQGVVVGLR